LCLPLSALLASAPRRSRPDASTVAGHIEDDLLFEELEGLGVSLGEALKIEVV